MTMIERSIPSSRFILLSSILLCCILHIDAQSAACPPLDSPCICVPSIVAPVGILCDGAGSLAEVLRAIQRARNIQIDSLMIVNTPISQLPPRAFDGFTIIRLVLNRNQLSSISDTAFDELMLDSLLELDMSHNNLRQLPTQGLPKLRTLRKLYLNSNGITTLPNDAFRNWEAKDFMLKLELKQNLLNDNSFGGGTALQSLKALTELSLEANTLTQIPSRALRSQKNALTNLNLGSNAIPTVPLGSLDLPKLESLSLEFNKIPNVDPEAFRQIPELLYLYMTGNDFNQWYPEMFRYVGKLRTLGMGEMAITTIPQDAFRNIGSLVRLEMSVAAVDTIEIGAFQRAPNIQAIIMNDNRLPSVPNTMFQNLNKLVSLDLQGNRLSQVEGQAFANLPALRHLDISYNELRTMEQGTFDLTFRPVAESRVLYSCNNPWVCDESLRWFRQWLRNNPTIQIDKPQLSCQAICGPNSLPEAIDIPLRNPDRRPGPTPSPLPFIEAASVPTLGWIILAVILTILLLSICLMAVARYFISKRHKEDKEEEEEDAKIVVTETAAPSIYGGGAQSVVGSQYQYPQGTLTYGGYAQSNAGLDLDLPYATAIDTEQPYWAY